jgi:poly(3-hydroxybutyrate) depolymerase
MNANIRRENRNGKQSSAEMTRRLKRGFSYRASIVLGVILLNSAVFALSYTDFRPDTIVSGSHFMPYRMFIPTSYTSAQKYPLVFYLHGGGGMGTDDIKEITDQTAGPYCFAGAAAQLKYPCFVVCPQMNVTDTGFATPANQAFIVAIIDSVAREFSIDRTRIYITGNSMGGAGTVVTMQNFPSVFAVAAPVCPWFEGGNSNSVTNALTKPWWFFHGLSDGTANPQNSKTLVDLLRSAGGHPNFTPYRGVDHFSWNNAYVDSDLVTWMFTKRLGWTWPLSSDSVYRIVNVGTQKCLSGLSVGSDSSVVIATANSTDRNQQWTLKDAGNGYYRLVNQQSGKALQIPGTTTKPMPVGTVVSQGAAGMSDNQLWLVWDIGDRYKLVPKLSYSRDSLCYAIGTQGTASAGAVPALVTAYTGTDAMRWTLEKVSAPAACAYTRDGLGITRAKGARPMVVLRDATNPTEGNSIVYDLYGRLVSTPSQKGRHGGGASRVYIVKDSR